jgi:hypothetical protein
MNMGVSTVPWGVVRRPSLARVDPSAGAGTSVSKLSGRVVSARTGLAVITR